MKSRLTRIGAVERHCFEQAPKEDGVIAPVIDGVDPKPALKILPTSPQIAVSYWSLLAQIVADIAAPAGRPAGAAPAAAHLFLDILMGRLSNFHTTQMGNVHTAGRLIADRVLAGGRLHLWSGRKEFYVEACSTAGGIRANYPVCSPGEAYAELDPTVLSDTDVVIIACALADPEMETNMARSIHATGAAIVGFHAAEREDGIPTDEFAGLCSVCLDNQSGDTGGVLTVPGYQRKVIPTLGLLNNYAYWAVIGAFVQTMEDAGCPPYYWMSNHVPGGHEYNDAIKPLFDARGY